MFRPLLGCLISALLYAGCAHAAWQKPPSSAPPPRSPFRAVLDRYCIGCHNERLRTAGLLLDKIDVNQVAEGAPVWEKVIRKLRTRAMPPAGMPRPDSATYNAFAAYLETELDRVASSKPNPGRPAVHRLNRAEYVNAVRDLLAIEVDKSLLPADDSGYGFDNIADVLSVSPTLLDRYMAAAEKVSRFALGDPAIRPVIETYDIPKLLVQVDRMSEGLPFGSRGGTAIRHHFPLDGEYVIRIRLQREAHDYIRGLAEPHRLEVRLDRARIKLFTVGGERKGKSGPDYSDDDYAGDPEQEEYERGGAERGLEVRFPAKAGTRFVGVSFLNEFVEPEGALHPPPTRDELSRYKGGLPAVSKISIAGPYNASGPGETPSRRKLFVCYPTTSEDEVLCASKILSSLARRAFRRPVTDGDVLMLLNFYRAGRTEGGFEAGIARGLERILIAPSFLFRIERDPDNIAPASTYRISDMELASRLSFFLWSSIPDDELLDVAKHGQLQNPTILEQQVRRMLADSRSEALVSNFAGQWLYVRNMQAVVPDPKIFTDFDENLREAFQRETELFLGSMLREDRSVLDLLDANYTFVNERLANHYQIPNISGSRFRRVTLEDENRKGLLGQGSILTVTSYANRTSPTLRGKWLLENILGTPPPPPPPDVNPALQERDRDGKVLTTRQQLEQHRNNAVCASCHSRMDPLGFALENFNAIGKWRTRDAGTLIDASGVLPDGARFEGPSELRKVLLSHPEDFVTTVVEKLLTYALGRGLEYYDMSAIRKITREAAPDYRWSSILLGVVQSAPFQMRSSGQP